MKVASQAGGSDFMDYHEAVTAVLEKAARIILPGEAVDIVAAAEREFARHGTCDTRFIEPIERALRECLRQWTPAQKRAIWVSTGTKQAADVELEDGDTLWLDLHLEGELMERIIDRLSGKSSGDGNPERDQDPW